MNRRNWLIALPRRLSWRGRPSRWRIPARRRSARSAWRSITPPTAIRRSPEQKAAPVSQDVADRLRKEERLRFKNYRLLGEDTQALASELRKLGANR